jgi:nucleotide-binding universal stress UspA family protein
VARRLTREAPCPVVALPAAANAGGEADPPLRRMLVGCEGRAGMRALRWAAALATDLDAELVGARVIAPAGRPPATATATTGRTTMVDGVTAQLDAEFAGLGERVRHHRSAVLVGDAPAMLLALAESEAADLVVLGVESVRRPAARLRPGAVASLLTRSAPCAVALVFAGAAARDAARDTDEQLSWRNKDMAIDAQRPRGVRFAAGTVVSPGEYRNCDTGTVRYFDGNTPIPGGVNSASWQQISDHHHPAAEPGPSRSAPPESAGHPVRFAAGSMVSPGEYRNCETGAVQYFDGNSPIPGGVNSASWQQVSDHFHPSTAALQPEPRHTMPDTASRPVRFPAGTMVSPGEYRNCDTGAVQYFDGTTPLPGGANSASWQQISDHHHPSDQRSPQVPERA